jgi:hypothetical protein
MGVDPARVIFANPCKRPADIAFARKLGVERTTFDTECELLKIAAAYPSAGCVLRLRCDDAGAQVRSGIRWGTAHTLACMHAGIPHMHACMPSTPGTSFPIQPAAPPAQCGMHDQRGRSITSAPQPPLVARPGFNRGPESKRARPFSSNNNLNTVPITSSTSNPQVQLGLKYGAEPHEVPGLLAAAKRLNLNVVGVSFHVGSGVRNYGVYAEAVRRARDAFDAAAALGFTDMTLLDVGGGFVAPHAASPAAAFVASAAAISRALDACFPEAEWPGLQVISEPGRYFAESAATLVAPVYSIRLRTVDGAPDGEIARRDYWVSHPVPPPFFADQQLAFWAVVLQLQRVHRPG